MLERIKDFVLSSTGEGISLRLKAATGLIVMLAGFLGFVVDTDELNAMFDLVGTIFTAVGALISAGMYVNGHWRKLFYKANKLGRYAR